MAKSVSGCSTIQDLNLYVRIKHENKTIFLYVRKETTGRDIKRALKQFTGRKIHDIKFFIPRMHNRKFADRLSFEQLFLEDGEVLIMTLRKPGTDEYESIEDVTGSYNLIEGAKYR